MNSKKLVKSQNRLVKSHEQLMKSKNKVMTRTLMSAQTRARMITIANQQPARTWTMTVRQQPLL
jgi:hypothetical protein